MGSLYMLRNRPFADPKTRLTSILSRFVLKIGHRSESGAIEVSRNSRLACSRNDFLPPRCVCVRARASTKMGIEVSREGETGALSAWYQHGVVREYQRGG